MKPEVRRKLIRLGYWTGSVLLVAYLATAFVMARTALNSDLCTGLRVAVIDPEHSGFVTAREISRELGDLPRRARGMRLADINTLNIRRTLMAIDKIEDVSVVKTSDGMVSVEVRPLHPVARIFDRDHSFYINKDGKRIAANARYHVDVPIIQGHFPPSDTILPPQALLPLLDYLSKHEPWNRLITMVCVTEGHDVVLVPAINGHVINLGSPSDLDSKMERVLRMYRHVMPVRGWNFYDTISVKWRNQVVATRRVRPVSEALTAYDPEEETPELGTMLTAEGVAPGQTRPGVPGHGERDFPAPDSASAASNSPR